MEKEKDYTGLWMLACIILALFWLFSSSRNNDVNPRMKHGVDTVSCGDSIYVFHFKIDTVFYNDDNYDTESEDN